MMNLVLTILITLLNLFSINSDSLKTQSEIKDVTVYRQQAQIQRTAGLHLKPGKNLVVFEGLSPDLLEHSLQLRGNKAFTILSLTKRINHFVTKNDSPVVENLRGQRDSLEKKLRYLNSDLSVLERELGLLGNTANMINNQELNASELTQLLDLYRSRVSKLEREKISLNEKIQNHRKELDKILTQLREHGNEEKKRFSEVIAEIHSEQDHEINIELEYVVYSAGWNPAYDIRGTDIATPLALSYKANIYQSTGIDWDDVTVTISSANPTLNSTLPEIYPTYLDFRPVPPASSRARRMEADVSGYYVESESINLEAKLEATSLPPVPTQSIQNQTSFSYKIDMPYSVPSDGKSHSLEFRREAIPASFVYASVPKYSEKAYLTGKITDWDKLDLIPGKASVYFENAFIGSTTINPLSFDDSLQVSLGVDESIVVERKKLREFEERNFFGNRVRENHSWEISVRNNKSDSVEIIVKDQVPLSKDESIKIESKKLSNGALDKESGIVTWGLKLAPGQTKTLRLDYQIKYPKGKEIAF